MKEKAVAIVLAGGSGTRMKTALPKQFINLASKPIIIHTLSNFENNTNISDIVVVCYKKYSDRLERLIKRNNIRKIYKVVPGGGTRQESSFIGLNNCPPQTKFVLIHDAVRPFVGRKTIERTLNAAIKTGAATTAIEVTDTIIKAQKGFIKNIPDRKSLKGVQTPQGFKYEIILKAHKMAMKKGIKKATDDCSLALSMGKRVKLVKGAKSNIKITDKTDLYLAEKLLKP
ncbi:2-C-methyl-D-erythritol 4-phosphate cytidylyltransferase [Patescibacteria group bacterium]|nr:2-C-methyl-D-erythritol 4-phosphate cytidylyltransferase [Patescibacteria group bacterium]